MTEQTFTILLLVTPLIVGAIISIMNSDLVNHATEIGEDWFRKLKARVSHQNGWFYQYLVHPLLWVIVKFFDWTDSFIHRGLKSGTRTAITLYLIAGWCYLIYSAFMLAVMLAIAIIVIYVIFKILLNSDVGFSSSFQSGKGLFDSSTQNSDNEAMDHVGLRGKYTYSGTNWFNEELKGRVDKHGNIYKGTSWLSEEKIGRIAKDGTVLQGTSYLNERKVGRIDSRGNLIKGSSWFSEEKTGRIDKKGNIHKGSNWFNEQKKGRSGK